MTNYISTEHFYINKLLIDSTKREIQKKYAHFFMHCRYWGMPDSQYEIIENRTYENLNFSKVNFNSDVLLLNVTFKNCIFDISDVFSDFYYDDLNQHQNFNLLITFMNSTFINCTFNDSDMYIFTYTSKKIA